LADPADQLLDQRDHHQREADRQRGGRGRRRKSEHRHRPPGRHAGEQNDEGVEHQSGAQRQEIGEDVDAEMAAALQGQVGSQHRNPDEQGLGRLIRPEHRIAAVPSDGAGKKRWRPGRPGG